jgi:hypothetical protein
MSSSVSTGLPSSASTPGSGQPCEVETQKHWQTWRGADPSSLTMRPACSAHRSMTRRVRRGRPPSPRSRKPRWALDLGERVWGVRGRSDGQNRGVAGRKRLLTPDLASAIAEKVAAGETVEAASTSLGLSSRSVRRWRREGEQELDRLSAEAQLALELNHARDLARPAPDWRLAAQALESLDPLHRGPPGSLDELLAGFDGERGETSD